MTIRNVQLGLTETEILVASGETAVLAILFCNNDTVTRTITIYCYPSGGSASEATTIITSMSIACKDTWIFSGNEKLLLDTGSKITAICDLASKVTATPSYKVL